MMHDLIPIAAAMYFLGLIAYIMFCGGIIGMPPAHETILWPIYTIIRWRRGEL